MLGTIADLLADPIDGSPLSLSEDSRRLTSTSGHSYDVAKQGYVTLASGKGLAHSGDSAEMVSARETFLGRGHYAPFVEAVSEAANQLTADLAAPVILEVGAGTGYYLAHTLDLIADSRGVGIDVSTAAAKKLAKAHPSAGAVVADIWERIPLHDSSVDIISVVFAPRNPQEFARVLKTGGHVVTLTPALGHLDELRAPLGIIGVESGKIERMVEQSAGVLELVEDPTAVEFSMNLAKDDIFAQVQMSPSARHIEDLADRVAALPASMKVSARAHLSVWRRV